MEGLKPQGLRKTVAGLDDRIGSKLPNVRETIFTTMTNVAKREGALNLSQGFPDFNPPAHLVESVKKYFSEGHHQYAPMPGQPELRNKISDKVEKLHGVKYDADDEITVTPGATYAIFTAISSIIREGDEVIILEPAYDAYAPAVLLNRGIPKYVALKGDSFEIDWNEVKRMISFHTRMIIINSPHNPTGTIFGERDFKQLEKISGNYDIFVLSDEVYEHMVFDGEEHLSACRFPKLRERSFVVSSFGKTFHATGWKIGYVLASKSLTREFRKVHQYNMFATPGPLQLAFADALNDEEHYLGLSEFYQKKRDLFKEGMRESRFKELETKGSYFACYDYSEISDMHDVEFAKWLAAEHKVACIPLSPFYHQSNDRKVIRFCFAKEDDTLKEAIKRLCKV